MMLSWLSRHHRRTAIASGWTIAGRLLGLAWTAALVSALSLADYGLYAMAFGASGLLVGFVDNPYLVRSLRVSRLEFAADRRSRMFFSLGLTAAGAAIIAWSTVGGLALLIAGGEIAMNAMKSSSQRDGHADRVAGFDLLRQISSIIAGVVAIAFIPSASLLTVGIAYCLPYLAFLIIGLVRYRVSLPRYSGGIREWTVLATSALIGAVYAQGDVILLGLIAGPEASGTYAIASLVAWTAASVLQNYALTQIPRLRLPKSTRPLREVILASAVLAAAVQSLGALLIALDFLSPLGSCLIYLGPFVLLRSANHFTTMELSIAGKDTVRLAATSVTAVVDLGLLVALSWYGAEGASIAASASEIVLFAWYWRAAIALRSPAAGPSAE